MSNVSTEKSNLTLSLKRHLWSSSSLRAAAITNSAVLYSSISAETLSNDLESNDLTKKSIKLDNSNKINDLQSSLPKIRWRKNYVELNSLTKHVSDSKSIVKKKLLYRNSLSFHKTVTFSISDPNNNWSKKSNKKILNNNKNLLRQNNLPPTIPCVECNLKIFFFLKFSKIQNLNKKFLMF